MPSELLSNVTSGSIVFVDANIFIYGLNGQSTECLDFLQKCKEEKVLGVTLLDVINDVTHGLMVAEAVAKRYIPRPAARALRNKASIIPLLGDYWVRTERIFEMGLLLLAADERIIRQAHLERMANALLTDDSLIVATMRTYGISEIASNDEDFGNITGIRLLRPSDVRT